jgi:transcriptional regulator with XRE-family HTH domain
MSRTTEVISEQLRRLIASNDESQYRICQVCDIDRATMSRFMNGKGGLSLEAIDRIGAMLGLRLKLPPAKEKGR